MTTTLVSWKPQVVYGPVISAHREALALTVASTKAIAPRKSGKTAASIKGIPTGELSGTIGSRYYVARFIAAGTKPHDIVPKERSSRSRSTTKRALAGPNFGPVGAAHSPGVKATHFIQTGAETYRANLVVAGRVAFLKGVF